MASKINGRDFDAPITPYVFDGGDYNTLRVHVDYDNNCYCKGGEFYVSLTPEKIEQHSGGFATRGFRITGTRDPLGSWIRVRIEQVPRNSQKRIDKIFENLTNTTRKEQIAWLFDQRRWDTLQEYVKEVALTGAFSGELNYGEAPAAEAQVQGEVNNTESLTLKDETTMETNMKAADLIGKTIIVGENIATITIKSADGDKLQGEFKKAGSTLGMQLPITLENLKQQVESGAWRLDEPAEEPAVEAAGVVAEAGVVTAAEVDEGEFADYEEVTEESEEESLPSRGDLEGSEDPVLQQWREAKAKSPDAVIIFRNGGAYVVLADDAEKVAEVAGLSLTHSNGTAICVFPTTELSVVLPKIVRAGIRTAIADLRPTPDPSRDGGEQAVAEQPKPRRVQPKAAKVEEPEEPSEEPEGTVTEEPAEDVVVEPSGKPEGDAQGRVQPKRASECTLEAKKCTPYIIDQGGSCVYVGGNTEKLEGVLYLMWGRKRAYQEGDNKYSGVQVSRKHKKMLEEILKIAC